MTSLLPLQFRYRPGTPFCDLSLSAFSHPFLTTLTLSELPGSRKNDPNSMSAFYLEKFCPSVIRLACRSSPFHGLCLFVAVHVRRRGCNVIM